MAMAVILMPARMCVIEGCYFDTGDDCIAIKSGRNRDGRDGRPSENIIVRNCRMKNGHGGVVIGSEISGGYRNLFVENCQMDSPLLDRVIRIKTNNCRGGIIENVYVRNVEVGECKEAVLKINLYLRSERNLQPCLRSYRAQCLSRQRDLQKRASMVSISTLTMTAAMSTMLR